MNLNAGFSRFAPVYIAAFPGSIGIYPFDMPLVAA
jgi:hypothetical protein